MEPTLHDGDLLLALWGASVRAGDVAVVRLPHDDHGLARPLSVKRLQGRDPDASERWWLDADNPRDGLTSFDVGSVPEADVLARVLLRLRPRHGAVRLRHTP